jgi:putative hydrolase of the HAD superfamily
MDVDPSIVKCLVFDLDGTLYDIRNGYLERIRDNIFKMMVEKGYAATKVEAEKVWRPLFRKYNQSFRGLNAGGFKFTADEYWSQHRAGMEEYFVADPVLRELLQRLPYKKVIFTNCREEEANRILDLLGVRDCFNATYGATFLGEICKPEEACFEKLLTTLELRAGEVLYFEDSVKNLRTADKLGMPCVLVHSETASEEGARSDRERSVGHVEGFDNPVVVVDTLNDGGRQLRAALPRLFHTVLE